jgi:hypothetical protein
MPIAKPCRYLCSVYDVTACQDYLRANYPALTGDLEAFNAWLRTQTPWVTPGGVLTLDAGALADATPWHPVLQHYWTLFSQRNMATGARCTYLSLE